MERKLTIRLGAGMDVESAEAVIRRLGEEPPGGTTSICFDSWPDLDPAVAWRLGNAIRPRSGHGRVEVDGPPLLEGGWCRTLDGSGLGYSLAVHADKITTGGVDVTAEVRRCFDSKERMAGPHAVIFTDLHRGVSVNPEREDRFREAFLKALARLGVPPGRFERGRLQEVIKLSFEAIQNVYDHAGRKPLPERTKISSYFLLANGQRFTVWPGLFGVTSGHETGGAELTSPGRESLRVCVSDDGVGIAARQSQDPLIYQKAKGNEELAVMEALSARSSVKFKTHDSPIRGTTGQGFGYIDSLLGALGAFAVLRTGRLLAVFDGTRQGGRFALAATDLGYMAGTTLDALIPIPK